MSGASSAVAEQVEAAYCWIPERLGTAGPIVREVSAAFGLVMDAPQVFQVDAICSVRSEDPVRWAVLEAALIEPRQNGKTYGVLLPIALYVALRRPDQLVAWSAHRYKTAREAFRSFLKLYRRSARLRAKVAKVTYAIGEEEVEFKNGSRIIFIARSQASGRGISGDLVILDEALFVTEDMLGALLPTLSAREDPLVIYASSAGLKQSAVLRDVRDRGRAGNDPSLVYVEHCAPEDACADEDCTHAKDAVGCACDDPEMWRMANPSPRQTKEHIAKERRAMPITEFCRERMGWWDEPDIVGSEFSVEMWDALAGTVGLKDPVVLWVDVAPGHAHAAIGATDGVGCELIEHHLGSAWVKKRLVELDKKHHPRAVAYDGTSSAPIASLIPDLSTAALPLEPVAGGDWARACSSIVRLVKQSAIRHDGSPEFSAAVAGARWRVVGDGLKLSRRDSTVDITPLAGLTAGLWVAGADPGPSEPGVWFI